MLFHSAELFWKSLVVLSGRSFEWEHEPSLKEFEKISDKLLPAEEKARLYKILSELSASRRQLATYGYTEKSGTLVAPSKIIFPDDVRQDLERVRKLAEALRRVHLVQVSTPPIRVGVLSGYVNDPSREIRCQSHPYSAYGTSSRWIEDLKKSLSGEDLFSGDLFAPVEIHVSGLGSGFYPMVINPFGECFPEKGQGRGMALETILEYIRGGGIFVSTGGHPFIYTWDVDAVSNNQRPLISYINVVTGIEVKKNAEGALEIVPIGGARFPGDALILTTEFKAACAWDLPKIEGPHEVEIGYDEKLRQYFKGRANVYRPVVANSPCEPVPLVVTDSQIWGPVYPVAAISYGRGFLISCGMNLDGEREYRILLDVIERIAGNGFDALLPSKDGS